MTENAIQEEIYKNRRNVRLESICRHMENKSTEIALRSVAYTGSRVRLSDRVFNFLYGAGVPYFLEEKRRAAETLEIVKYIMQNSLLPTLEGQMKKRNPSLHRREVLIMGLNIQFKDDGYQNAPNSNTPLASLEVTRRREDDSGRKIKKVTAKVYTPEEIQKMCLEKMLKKEREQY